LEYELSNPLSLSISIFIRLSSIWNAVPGDIKAETTLSSFKLSLSLSILWNVCEIHLCTAVVDESEEWSSQ